MKKIFIALLLLAGFQYAGAQEAPDSLPVYQRFPTVPPFTIMSAPDSIAFSKDDLKRRKPVIIIVFSPDCDHCKRFTKELLAHYSLVKNARIIMSSALNYDNIKKFYEEDKIADYPNITVGRDGTNFLSTFFKVRSFPTVVIYNKKGNFVKRFDGAVTIDKIAAEL